jgi:hypothetical protein
MKSTFVVDRNINVHNVAILHLPIIRDSVTHNLIYRRAHTLWESAAGRSNG